MPQVKPRLLTNWEQAEKARLEALQHAKQAKLDKYRSQRHKATGAPVRSPQQGFMSWNRDS